MSVTQAYVSKIENQEKVTAKMMQKNNLFIKRLDPYIYRRGRSGTDNLVTFLSI
jgi:hypothetical protein